MEWSGILTLLSIGITIAVLVILIVVLARNPLENSTDENLIKITNKIKTLYILEIIATSIMVLSLFVGFFMYRRIPVMVC